MQISNKQKYHKSKWSDELNIVFSTENHIGHHNTSHSPFNMYADKTISQQKTKLGVRSDLSENNFFLAPYMYGTVVKCQFSKSMYSANTVKGCK